VTAHVWLQPGDQRLGELRRTLASVAAEIGVDEFWLTLAATELATNALAASPSGGTVEVSVGVVADGRVELTVTDEGPGPPELPASLPPPSSVRGRGLYLVQELSESFWFEQAAGRTIARCRHARLGDPSGESL
jgi:anti-sigma regulatory factor (Ser/Thr protein kinase)